MERIRAAIKEICEYEHLNIKRVGAANIDIERYFMQYGTEHAIITYRNKQAGKQIWMEYDTDRNIIRDYSIFDI